MSYVCTICDGVFDEGALEDAIQVSGGRGRSRLPIAYRFLDGSFHLLRKLKTKKKPQEPSPEPKEDTELLLEVASVLAALPTPPMPEPELKIEPLPQIEPDFEEGEALTPMQLAFRRIQEK